MKNRSQFYWKDSTGVWIDDTESTNPRGLGIVKEDNNHDSLVASFGAGVVMDRHIRLEREDSILGESAFRPDVQTFSANANGNKKWNDNTNPQWCSLVFAIFSIDLLARQ